MLRLKHILTPSGAGIALPLSILIWASMPVTAETLFEATGMGRFNVTPDQVRFQASVSRVMGDATEAREEIARVVSALEKTINRYDLIKDSLDSIMISVNPDYEWDSKAKKQVFVGYRVTRNINFTVRGTAEIGTILNTLSESGATQISPPSLRYSNPDSGAQQALENALINAMDKLKVMASAVDVSISDVVSVTEITEHSPLPMGNVMRTETSYLADSASQVAVASLTYSSKVRVIASGD